MISARFRNDSKPLLKLNDIQKSSKNQVEKKILSQKYKFEEIVCPICESNRSELLSEKDRYGLSYRVVMCKDCGLTYTNPRMTQASYNEFYDLEYRKLYGGTKLPTNSYLQQQIERGKDIYDFVKSSFPKKIFEGLNVLEVGCGSGGILYYFSQKGCNVLGIDLGSDYLKTGRDKFSINLKQASINDNLNFIPDLVIYSHVIEHILDLNQELQKLKSISHKDTIFYIEVPGIKNIHNAYKMDILRYLQNAHTFHFSLTSLKNLFEKNGFELIRGTEFVKSIFKLSLNTQTEKKMTNDFDDVSTYLKKLEKQRHFYRLKPSTLITAIKYYIKFWIAK